MRYRYSYLIALLLTLVLAACGGQTAGDVSGTWNGQISDSTTQLPFVMTLTQTGTSISGAMVVQGGQLTLIGTATESLVSLAAREGGLQLNGGVSGDTMQGNALLTFTDGTSGTFPFSATKQ